MKSHKTKKIELLPNFENWAKFLSWLGILPEHSKKLVKQLFCPHGHSLIFPENPLFDGQPGVHLICEGEKYRQSVYVSPFFGDGRKQFSIDYQPAELLYLFCPICEIELPRIAPHDCHPEAYYVGLFQTQPLEEEPTVCLCNVWGCEHNALMRIAEVLQQA
ncbi:MAG: hypothetical protein Kow0042_04160 [Calditrichia bacterium]